MRRPGCSLRSPRLHPDLSRRLIWNCWGIPVLMSVSRNSEALVHTQKAVDLDPENFEARFSLGTMLLIQQRVQDAIAQLNEAHRLRPDDPRPRELLDMQKRR